MTEAELKNLIEYLGDVCNYYLAFGYQEEYDDALKRRAELIKQLKEKEKEKC